MGGGGGRRWGGEKIEAVKEELKEAKADALAKRLGKVRAGGGGRGEAAQGLKRGMLWCVGGELGAA
jgi:hypothetical protein